MSRKYLTPIALPVDPVNPLEAATKQYVDARGVPSYSSAISSTYLQVGSDGLLHWVSLPNPDPYYINNVTTTTDWNTLVGDSTDGGFGQVKVYSVPAPANPTTQHAPATAGAGVVTVTTSLWAQFYNIQTWVGDLTTTGPGQFFRYKKYGGAWTAWTAVGGGGGSVDEVSISATDPGATYELWVDTTTPNLANPDVARWNSAWGVVAKGTVTSGNPLKVPTGGMTATSALPVTLTSGRRFRFVFNARAAVTNPAVAGAYMQLWLQVNGGNQFGASVLPSVPSSGYNTLYYEWLVDGDGTSRSWTVMLQGSNPIDVYTDTEAHFYVEDVGPVAMSSPPPGGAVVGAWTTWLAGDMGPSWVMDASQPPQWRIMGDKVEMRGRATVSSASTFPFYTPAGAKPPTGRNVTLPAAVGNGVAQVYITASTITLLAGATSIILDGICYSQTV